MSDLLFTLAYPVLHEADRERIETFRQSHDIQFRDMVAAHFTFVFGYAELDRSDYIEHVSEIAGSVEPIDFV